MREYVYSLAQNTPALQANAIVALQQWNLASSFDPD